ncbi:electron transporter [Panicum miliaceum]|uniref:Electron transporter n=1 Tax=Panicum miliaceum TaxID=4540 RepID=A0A3L6SIN9_PANMI|nr:electron transporter [Panicum miliaceum]
MWLPWVKTRPSSTSPSSATSTSSSSSTALVAAAASPRLSFSSPSLKDLQALLLSDAATPSPPPAAPCSPSSSTVRVFHRVRVAASALRALRTLQAPPSAGAGADRRVVLYFTSLHVVRSTYEDCRAVRAILRGLRVSVDERDLAMDPRYLEELSALLPRLASPRRVTLPQVFVGGRHLGGADELRRLHEAGELRRVVAGAVAASLAACGRCGGERYVLCSSCNGSHKRYSVKGGGGFRTCAGCNENGLVRCPDCSPPDV